VRQGETAQFTVKVEERGFDDVVNLTFSQLPEGVTITNPNPRIDKGGKEATFTFAAAPDAKIESGQKVKVAANGGGMTAGPEEFTVNVKAKK